MGIMKKKLGFALSVLLALVLILPVAACGTANDPMLDDIYSRDIFPGEDSIYDIGSVTHAYAEGHFDTIFLAGVPAGGGVGDVVGPAGATDHALVRYDGATGKLIEDSSGVTIDDFGNLTVDGDLNVNDINAENDLNCVNDLEVTDDAEIGGNLTADSGTFISLTVNGNSISAPAYGEAYISSAVATTCASAGTFYLVSGTTTADELQDFTHNGNGRLTYTGDGNRVCLIAVAISVSSDTNNVILSTKVYVNGAAHEPSLIKRKIATAGDIGAQALITLTTLTTSDYIELYIATDKTSVDITFNCMSLTATTVD